MTDVLTSRYLAVGSPTLNNQMLPTIAGFLCYLKGLSPKGRKAFAFGSYGWGGGMFMETWTERTQEAGANMVADGVTCENEPDDDALARCRDLGAAMAKAVG